LHEKPFTGVSKVRYSMMQANNISMRYPLEWGNDDYLGLGVSRYRWDSNIF
jgi:hypothetical protein